MKYLTFSKTEQREYPICLLVPQIRKDEIRKAYIDPHGLSADEFLVVQPHYSEIVKKTPAAEIKAWIQEELVPALGDLKTEFVLVADPDYFKILTKVSKVDINLGYVLDSEFGSWKVIYVPSFKQIFYDPDKVRSKIAQGMDALKAYRTGSYEVPGSSIIRHEAYPHTADEIGIWLNRLLEMNAPLAADIETFSLKHYSAGIGTISFAWNQHEGIAFPVDLGPEPQKVRALLREFFKANKQPLIWHKADFDVYVLIYQLFMDHILDTAGLLDGLEIMLPHNNWEDTRIISYLATNSCAGNKLSLKDQAQEFSGNYALLNDDPDITKIPLGELLRYNLVDTLSTWFVKNKHWDTVIRDDQLTVYRELFQPAMRDIIQMQLTGLPVDMKKVQKAKAKLQKEFNDAVSRILNSPLVEEYVYALRENHVFKRNNELKKKRITMDDDEVLGVVFNPNSGAHLQGLLYNQLALPVISKTDTGMPSVDGDTLESLQNHTDNPAVLALLRAFVEYGEVNKILTVFIPALERAVEGPDGWHYLFGCFNLGGTVSGRLSSSDPNLQNLPATGTKYAKIIKECFAPPPGWMFVGLDFFSLEDRISALTTKDPNKLKVYTDGYDGHSLRAYTYYGDGMPDINPDSVDSINSIKTKYEDFRQESKTPTFLLTYGGTYIGMMAQCGFDKEKAQRIESRYHELYEVSDRWVSAKLDEAAKNGYVTIAFGLRLRTPKLSQVIRGNRKTPYEAEAEGRTAGNALGQSWCLLNSRAWSEFMTKVRAGPYREMIRPCAQIHDAGYALIRDDLYVLRYTNEHLVKAVEWQEHPDIQHDEVTLGGELSIFYPDWSQEIGIKKDATEEQILQAVQKHLEKIQNGKS